MREKDLEAFLLFLKSNDYQPKTQKAKWLCVKKFFRYLDKEFLFENLKPKFNARKTKLPEELLTEEEVSLMIQKANSLRDKAFIASLYESGCRIGEILSRKIRHLNFDKYGVVLMVDGKTGMRRIRLINSVPLLSNWLANHPLKDNPDSFLWISLKDCKNPVRHRAMDKMLKETAGRAGIRKKVHPHLFRHSRATHMASKLTEYQMKEYFGWTQASEMASVYVHLSGRDVDDAILEMNGVKSPDKKPAMALKPIACPRCENVNDSSSKFCSRCGMVVDVREAAALNETKEPGVKEPADIPGLKEIATDPEFRKFLAETYALWKANKNQPNSADFPK